MLAGLIGTRNLIILLCAVTAVIFSNTYNAFYSDVHPCSYDAIVLLLRFEIYCDSLVDIRGL